MEEQKSKEEISNVILKGKAEEIEESLSKLQPFEIADLIQALEPEDQSRVINSLDTKTASEVILEIEPEVRQELLKTLDLGEIAEFVEEMDSDDAADLIGELPDETARLVLEKLPPREVEEVETLLKYAEDSAGGIMQKELVEVQEDSTVADAINWIRLIAEDVEDFHEIYVVDDNEKLLGVVTPKKLLLSNPRAKVNSIMAPVEITATPSMDQEAVGNLFEKYDIFSLPVVGEDGELIGRITADDVIDVITEEASEDMYQLAGVQEYLHPIYTPTATRVRLRTPWLILTLFGELIIAFVIIYTFKPTLQKVAILAAFMPAIMATGGNVGLQTVTIVIRGLGMGTIHFGEMITLILAELKVGLIIGLICGSLAAVIGSVISMNEPQVAKLSIAVFVAMVTATVATSFIGVAGPLTLYKLKFDPAAASGPFLTMFNDLFGSVVYLFIAMMIF
ncbi:MAG: magnesium transporter [Thermodesulfobacteriota bacterium]